MSLDIEVTASYGPRKVRTRITTPVSTANGDSGEAVTQFVSNTIDLVATTATNLAMTAIPATLALGEFPPVNEGADADIRTNVSITHSLDNLIMLDIYELEGTARPIFVSRDEKVFDVLGSIFEITGGAQDLVLVNYRGETLDLDATLAEVNRFPACRLFE